jgi:hypothetical protein
MANSGFDFLWIETQQSPLSFEDVARMIYACRGAPAIRYIYLSAFETRRARCRRASRRSRAQKGNRFRHQAAFALSVRRH